jgi:hypothetical protein
VQGCQIGAEYPCDLPKEPPMGVFMTIAVEKLGGVKIQDGFAATPVVAVNLLNWTRLDE